MRSRFAHRTGTMALLAGLVACAQSSDPKTDTTPRDAIEADGSQAIEEAVADGDDQDRSDLEPDVVLAVPWGAENRGFRHLRGIVHAHSIHSHDGCAPDAPPLGSEASLQCLAEMRAAPCLAGIDFLMQTDHPKNVADTPFLDALHYQPEAGDMVMRDEDERPLANRVLCPEGSLVTHFYFYVGTEGGGKNMPVALSGPIPGEVFSTGYKDSVPLETAQAAIKAVHELGGVALAAHTEEADISVERIVALPLDGIEIYNFHANILEAIQNFERLLLLDRFMGASGPDRPVADLAFLTFLQPTTRNIQKFDKAAQHIRLIHVAANDVHRNVEFPALCEDIGDNLCGNFADKGYPEFAAFLARGGPFALNDGDRLDSYARSYKWFSNHLFVNADDPDRIRKALRQGHGFSAFDGMGYPQGFDFFAMRGEEVLEMGQEVPFSPGIILYVRAPTVVSPPWGLPRVTDWSAAEVTTRLIRATDTGSEVVLVLKVQGETAAFPVPGPGVYRVECDIVPRHLEPALPGVEDLAHATYPYIYSNAIFIRKPADGQ